MSNSNWYGYCIQSNATIITSHNYQSCQILFKPSYTWITRSEQRSITHFSIVQVRKNGKKCIVVAGLTWSASRCSLWMNEWVVTLFGKKEGWVGDVSQLANCNREGNKWSSWEAISRTGFASLSLFFACCAGVLGPRRRPLSPTFCFSCEGYLVVGSWLFRL